MQAIKGTDITAKPQATIKRVTIIEDYFNLSLN